MRPTMRTVAMLIGLLSASMALPAQAASAPHARLVHCGQDTCLRLSGHRPRPAVAIRVAGQDLAVAGSRDWVATVPLWTARDWERSGDALTLTYVDRQNRAETTRTVMLPPGALGRHVELAALVVRVP